MPNHCKALLGKDCMSAFEVSAAAKTVPSLLLSDKFPGVKDPGRGKYPDCQHVTKLTADVAPRLTKLRTVPLARREAVKNEIQSMVVQGTWEPCETSEWQHELVTVPKPNGLVRITTDLTPLNMYVVPNRHPLSNIKDCCLLLRGAKVSSKMDLSKAYCTIAIAPKSRHLTAGLVTDQGVFQY